MGIRFGRERGVMALGMIASLVAAAIAAGCGDDDAVAPTDAGAEGTVPTTPDGSTPLDSGADTATDTGADAGQPQPKIVPLSMNGHDRLYGVTFDAAGNIYAVGRHTTTLDASEDWASVVAKLTPEGALDTTWNGTGIATVNMVVGGNAEFARGIVVQSTGKVVIAGIGEALGGDPRDRDVYLARFNANGTIDTGFGTNGVVTLDFGPGAAFGDGGTSYIADGHWGLSLAANDMLVVTGSTKNPSGNDADFAITRLDANGVKDPAFAPATNNVFVLPDVDNRPQNPRNATVLADGSLVMGGYQTDPGNIVSPVLFKITSVGALDTTFGTGGVFNQQVLGALAEVYQAAPQGTSFVTAGYGRNTTQESIDILSIRVTGAGALDTTYGTNGLTRVDLAGQADRARALVVLPDQRVMLVGAGSPSATPNTNAAVAVLTKDGQPDLTFGPKGLRTYDLGGPGDFFWSAAVSPDNTKVAAVGLFGADTDGGGDDDAALLILPLPLP